MNLVLSKRKKTRIKKNILRGVFIENMRMVGKNYERDSRRKFLVATLSSIFFLSVIIYFVLSNFTYIDHPLFQYGRLSFFQPKKANHNINSQFKEKNMNNLGPSQYSTFLNELKIPLRTIFGLKVKTIIIDPGHGGEDPGAIGKLGTKEKDITLDISKRLRDKLEKNRGYQIVMTREDDITLSLEDRIEYANSQKADLYISIHVNYIPSKPFNVIETYYFGPHSDKQALKLAEKENRGSQYTMSDFNKIIKRIENTLKTQESNLLAMSIQDSLYKNIKKQNKNSYNYGTKTAPFIVLLGVNVPSVLTEVTCLSNREEEKNLNDENYREEISKYLEEGITNYLNKKNEKREVHYATKRDPNKAK